MTKLLLAACACLAFTATPSQAETKVICMLAVSAQTGKPLVEEGDCGQRMSPASTFKIAISLMGFDSGVLQSPTAPELPFKDGYIDDRPEWRRAQNPTSWMRDSVIWYSQQTTSRLGMEKFAAYVTAFDYGNRDLAGDPGRKNGLTNAWLSSSLQVSPAEQVAFLRKLVRHELPVSDKAVESTSVILDQGMKGNWHVFGKTGAGGIRTAEGKLSNPFGWFVGWAQKGSDTVVFARLIQDTERQPSPPGMRAREGLVEDLFSGEGVLR
ncbi:class D beta-lactamase [Propylenella binzhouense]|uniref:Beta-lactamase n=1 Tax=Propylenella binzhouense TaxID=2555902 RepID=A0A964T970_9HYPH|nr:class D beta-lactamase [Propylenella binzhouense]MYZ50380.1 class D beta-lactamase [Propylenella binzhouense]